VKPPKCPICGSHHHLREPHVFSEERPQQTAAEPKPAASLRMANDVANDVANVTHVANSSMANEPAKAAGLNRASPTYKYRNPTQRRAYMADYMRAYRKRSTVRAAIAP
jgi:hypothetical protein